MRYKQSAHITDSEWPIMEVLWDRDTATAAEIVQAVTLRRDTSMRTIKTLLRRLVQKELVRYEVDARDSRIYHYSPAVTRQTATEQRYDHLLRTVYRGDVSSMLVHFLRESKLSPQEWERIKALAEALDEEEQTHE